VVAPAGGALVIAGGVAFAAIATHGGGVSSSTAAGAASSQRVLRPAVPMGGANQTAEAGSAQSFAVVTSGTDYLPARLQAEAGALLARDTATPRIHGLVPAVEPVITGCVTRITGGRLPTIVDQARYQGQPATVIVLAGTGAAPGQVWIARPACPAANSAVVTHLLLPAP